MRHSLRYNADYALITDGRLPKPDEYGYLLNGFFKGMVAKITDEPVMDCWSKVEAYVKLHEDAETLVGVDLLPPLPTLDNDRINNRAKKYGQKFMGGMNDGLFFSISRDSYLKGFRDRAYTHPFDIEDMKRAIAWAMSANSHKELNDEMINNYIRVLVQKYSRPTSFKRNIENIMGTGVPTTRRTENGLIEWEGYYIYR